ncbi:hypothetical protein SUGI_0222460 [Cryptomeria japonica]|nr:hypothetical protein SUGI_0222460 [Cryptomeria japonica]
MKGKGPGYEINGEIMILAVALLACAVFFTFCLHFYAKWFWRHSAALTLNAALGSSRRRRFTFAETEEEDYGISENVGLEKSVIDALPLFVYRLQSGTKVQPEQGFSAVEISEDVGSHSEEGGTSSDSAKVPVTRICSLRRLLGRENKVKSWLSATLQFRYGRDQVYCIGKSGKVENLSLPITMELNCLADGWNSYVGC